FFLPSLFEGLPVTCIEAQANGLQCVISDSITKEKTNIAKAKAARLIILSIINIISPEHQLDKCVC
ncbi:MAG: hypothetical protein K6F64_09040, partial [Clostridia bacterium]|nr:hypothetical protein [Clostridia bacterium]